jgi:hypothetical protein
MWKAVGDAGWEARIDHCVALADHFQSALAAPKWGGAFRLVMPRACTNVCFWWVPPVLRPFDPETATEAELAAIGRAAPRIKALMQARLGLGRAGGGPARRGVWGGWSALRSPFHAAKRRAWANAPPRPAAASAPLAGARPSACVAPRRPPTPQNRPRVTP